MVLEEMILFTDDRKGIAEGFSYPLFSKKEKVLMHYNCLIIDDETDLAKMTCEYFQAFDVTCTYVESSEKCLSFLKENTVDLLLLDINLQEESGFSLCKKIREQSEIPILFISARQSDDDVLIALNIGGDDYIKKPYTLSVLLAKVKIILKRMVNNGGKYIKGLCGGKAGNFKSKGI